MTTSRVLVGLAIVSMAAGGCSTMSRKDCAIVGGILGGTVGGVGGAVLVNNLEATPSDGERAAGAAGGGVAGIVIGALIGYNVCEDPAPEPVAAPPPPPPGTEIVEIRGTHFAFDSDRLTSEGEAILEDAVEVMNRHPSITVTCEGHTDSVGSEEYNMDLGQRRAESACDFMASAGISPSRLTPRSFGETDPAESNETAEGRAANRRVEIVVD